jgi:hypothetical protein
MSETASGWYIYDIKYDAILHNGTLYECDKIIDTFTGDPIITTKESIKMFRSITQYELNKNA